MYVEDFNQVNEPSINPEEVYEHIQTIQSDDKQNEIAKIKRLYQFSLLVLEVFASDKKLVFHTLYSRVAYLGLQYKISHKYLFQFHLFRRYAEKGKKGDLSEYMILLAGMNGLAEITRSVTKKAIPPHLIKLIPDEVKGYSKSDKMVSFIREARIIILAVDNKKKELSFYFNEEVTEELILHYDETGKNELFTKDIETATVSENLPLSAYAINLLKDEEEKYHFGALVLHPDYLIDVTTVANSFQFFGIIPESYYLRKFLPQKSSIPILIGNLVNHFLDRLMLFPDTTFEKEFIEVFGKYPFIFSLMDDSKLREVMEKSRNHFQNIKNTIILEFPKLGIKPGEALLEPSFYSDKYGLQGRLDLLHPGNKNSIVELKSGKPFRPNVYGLNISHYIQTLLYDLLIKSAFGRKSNSISYIMYSSVSGDSMRFAPAVSAQQFEALAVRNRIVMLEHYLGKLSETTPWEDFIAYFAKEKWKTTRGYVKDEAEVLHKLFSSLSEFERTYFLGFVGFIAREHNLAKSGVMDSTTLKGQATLWLASKTQKQEHFSILSGLEIEENFAEDSDPLLILGRRGTENSLANFRKGDLAVLYPEISEADTPLSSQLLKGTIIQLEKDRIVFRLRQPQFNQQVFKNHRTWNLEPDMLDSGYNAQYRHLTEFFTSENRKRNLILGIQPPKLTTRQALSPQLVTSMTKNQQIVLKQALSSKDYFLIWGPPGTGKTSVLLKELVRHLHNNENESLLLVAYTNRAVDEICDVLEKCEETISENYIRIGSRYNCGEEYRHRLIHIVMEEKKTRREFVDLLKSKRIVVGTLASLLGQPELFIIKHFNSAIIDEASQILEPMLINILTRANRFILIGDHLQLPAVVQQKHSEITSSFEDFKKIELRDYSDSYFERMVRLSEKNGWDHVIGLLSEQGRMHSEIMELVNDTWYNGQLNILPGDLGKRQTEPLSITNNPSPLFSNRTIFIPIQCDESEIYAKTNTQEAKLIAAIVSKFINKWKEEGKQIHRGSLGIITPFRAQIACIRDQFSSRDIPWDLFSVDTVERYQGSARDIIILSTTVSNPLMLKNIKSANNDGLDRKLNVALTRAREQLIILGDLITLSTDTLYKEVINKSTSIDATSI